MKKNLVGSIIRIAIGENEFCYARILDDLDYAFYDYKSLFKNDNIEEIIHRDILFTALVHSKALKEGGWEVIGKIPLDERHKKKPIYYHPDLTNVAIYAYTVSKIKESLKYKTFENGGLQDGGIYSAKNIEDRLRDYYAGLDYKGITILLDMLSHLKTTSSVSK